MTFSLIEATFYSAIAIPTSCISIVSELELHFQAAVINQLKTTRQIVPSLHLFIVYQMRILVWEMMSKMVSKIVLAITLHDY